MLEIQKFTKIIAANWKMNGSINFINNFLNDLDDLTFENINDQSICIIICPPFTYSYLIANKLKKLLLRGAKLLSFSRGCLYWRCQRLNAL